MTDDPNSKSADESAHGPKMTFEAAEDNNLRAWRSLTLQERLLAAQDLADMYRHVIAERAARGLPYIDPATGEVVRP
jgi:uncharacterized protein YigA (DUF484 family)